MGEPCKRSSGTERRWFETPHAAAKFRDAHPVQYGEDVIVLCGHCGLFHLSHPNWLPQKPWEKPIEMLRVN
jgi:hypothetical protein